jgi:hypothetical protein
MKPCLIVAVEGWVFVVAVQCLRNADSGDGRKLKLSYVLVHCGCASSHFKFRSTFHYFCEVCNRNTEHDLIYLLTAVGLSPGGSKHLRTNTTWNNTNNNRTTQIMW